MTPEQQPPRPVRLVPALLLGLVGVGLGLFYVSRAPAPADPGVPAPPNPVLAPDTIAPPADAPSADAPPPWSRQAAPRNPRTETLLALGQSLRMPGQALEVPCRAVAADGTCTAHALDSFFAALDQAAQKKGQARITVFGNSLIISDRIVDVWREALQQRFGDAGRGFLYADRQANYGARSRTADEANGLSSFNVVWGERGRHPHGIGGALHVADRDAQSVFVLDGATRARLFFLDHKRSADLTVTFDDRAPQVVAATHEGPRVVPVPVPAGAARMTVRWPAGSVAYGVSVERPSPGIILDNISIIGADSTRYLRIDEDIFRAQLPALSPQLVTILLGGNEVKRVAWGGSTLPRVKRDLAKFLQRIQETLPGVPCLVTGPLENVQGAQPTKEKNPEPVAHPWKKRWQTDAVREVMHEVAVAAGCAYFDTFAAMGGDGALRRLNDKRLLNEDMIHPQGDGLDLLGALLHDALLDEYEQGTAAPTTETAP